MRHIALWAIIPPSRLSPCHLSFALRAAYGGCAMYAPAGAAFRQGRLWGRQKNKCPPPESRGQENSCGTTSIYRLRGLWDPNRSAKLYRAHPSSPTACFQRSRSERYSAPSFFLPCTHRQFSGKRGGGAYWFSSTRLVCEITNDFITFPGTSQ